MALWVDLTLSLTGRGGSRVRAGAAAHRARGDLGVGCVVPGVIAAEGLGGCAWDLPAWLQGSSAAGKGHPQPLCPRVAARVWGARKPGRLLRVALIVFLRLGGSLPTNGRAGCEYTCVSGDGQGLPSFPRTVLFIFNTMRFAVQ